jgi:hypothetical protein
MTQNSGSEVAGGGGGDRGLPGAGQPRHKDQDPLATDRRMRRHRPESSAVVVPERFAVMVLSWLLHPSMFTGDHGNGNCRASYVPFGAAVWRATVAVLSRCSVLGRVRSVSGSGAAGAAHSTDCRERFCCSLQSGQAASVLAPVAAPGTAHVGVWKTRPPSIFPTMAWRTTGAVVAPGCDALQPSEAGR